MRKTLKCLYFLSINQKKIFFLKGADFSIASQIFYFAIVQCIKKYMFYNILFNLRFNIKKYCRII